MNQDILNYLIPDLLFFALFVVASGSLTLLIIRNKKARARLKIKATCEKAMDALDDIPAPRQREDFSSSLSTASLTTRFQETKLKNQAGVNREIPEKYKISAKMAARGMSAEEISSVLDISSAEASQLVQLHNIRIQDTGDR